MGVLAAVFVERETVMRLVRGIGTIKPEQRQVFLQALNKQVQASRKEEGVIEFAAYQSVEDPNTFVLIEVYRDVAAQEQHHTQPYTEAFKSSLADCLAAPPDVKTMDGDWLTT